MIVLADRTLEAHETKLTAVICRIRRPPMSIVREKKTDASTCGRRAEHIISRMTRATISPSCEQGKSTRIRTMIIPNPNALTESHHRSARLSSSPPHAVSAPLGSSACTCTIGCPTHFMMVPTSIGPTTFTHSGFRYPPSILAWYASSVANEDSTSHRASGIGPDVRLKAAWAIPTRREEARVERSR